jgi:hypothetical protein
VNGEFLYATTGTLPGSLVVFNAGNESVVWQKLAGGYSSLPIIGANGNLYVSSETTLYAYDKYGELQWQHPFLGGFAGQPGQPVTDADAIIYASSFDYRTNETTLYAFSSEGTELWHWIRPYRSSGTPV